MLFAAYFAGGLGDGEDGGVAEVLLYVLGTIEGVAGVGQEGGFYIRQLAEVAPIKLFLRLFREALAEAGPYAAGFEGICGDGERLGEDVLRSAAGTKELYGGEAALIGLENGSEEAGHGAVVGEVG